MKIVCIADLQGQCESVTPDMLPKGDMLLVAGDLASWGDISELNNFNKWLGKLDYKYKVIVAGNHDQDIENIDGHKLFTNATYLQDELVEIEGIKIYGTPANDMNDLRLWKHWAFCEPDYLRKVSKEIPEGIDILLSHGGCYGILDQLSYSKKPVGSKDLLDAVLRVEPKYHVFGHIHEAHGKLKKGKTTFINAALCNEKNYLFDKEGKLLNKPIMININLKDKRKKV